jgi:hypothetical protein
MNRIGLIGFLMLLTITCQAFADSNLVVLEGSLIQTTDYVYRLTLEPEGRTLDANVAMLDAVDQPWYKVTILEQSFTSSTSWSSRRDAIDLNGNQTAQFDWSSVSGQVVLERHVRSVSEAIYGHISLSDPFPMDENSLPWSIRNKLRPTDQYQSTDSTIAAFASGITGPSPTQLDAVVRILSWIRREVRYACSAELCDPVYRTDALFTMQKRMGNCVSYANLSIAMLRAVGIPAVVVNGFVADRAESKASHAWIAVYFPSHGWIEFESADWMPAYGEAPQSFLMPQHITIWRDAEDPGISHAGFSERHEAVFEITERPEEKTHVAVRAEAGQPISWVLTVKNPVYEDSLVILAVESAPEGWDVVLSETSVFISDGSASRSVDVLLTIIPSGNTTSGTSNQVVVVCTHEGAEVGSTTFSVTVP